MLYNYFEDKEDLLAHALLVHVGTVMNAAPRLPPAGTGTVAENLRLFIDTGLATLTRVASVGQYRPSVVYPNNGFGQALQAVAGAMVGNFGTKVFYVPDGARPMRAVFRRALYGYEPMGHAVMDGACTAGIATAVPHVAVRSWRGSAGLAWPRCRR